MLQLPVDVRSASLVILATVASVFMLRWASVVFIPVLVGLLGSYALSPVVDWLQLRRIPRAVSAALLILGVLAGIGATGYSLSDDASRLVESLPAAAQKLPCTSFSSHFLCCCVAGAAPRGGSVTP